MPSVRSAAVALAVLVALGGAWAWLTWGERGRGAASPDSQPKEKVASVGPNLQGLARERTTADASADAPAASDPDEHGVEEGKPFAVPARLVIDVVGWRDRPLAGAVLTLEAMSSPALADPERMSLVTDSAGRAWWDGVRTADVAVRVEASGYGAQEGSLSDLKPGEERHQRIALVPEGPLRGRVVRAGDGAPVAEAQVFLRDQAPDALYQSELSYDFFRTHDPVTTDASGRFQIEGVQVGTEYTLWAVAAGLARGERGVVLLSPDSRPEIELALEAEATLRFRVVDSSDQPVEDYRVVLVPEDVAARLDAERERASRNLASGLDPEARDPLEDALGADLRLHPGSGFSTDPEPLYGAWTSAQGVATIHGLAHARPFRVAPASGERPFESRRWVAQWGDPPLVVQAKDAHPDADVVLRVADGAILRVRCMTRGGKPCKGTPDVTWRGSRPQWTNLTENVASFHHLSPGTGALDVVLPGHAPSRTMLELPPGKETEIDVVLDELPKLRGRVVDETGRAYVRGHVQVQGSSWGASIGSDGRFEMPGVPPGRRAVSVHSPDAVRPLHAELQIEGAELTITLPRGASGRVRAALPAALLVGRSDDRGVFLRLHEAPPEGEWARASLFDHGLDAVEIDAGRYEWLAPPGAYTLTAVSQGCAVLRRRLELRAGAELDLGELSPALTAPLKGLVELADGTAAAYARVRLEGYDVVHADGRGRFSLAHGPQGPIRAIVGGDKYLAVDQLLRAPAAGDVLRLRASRGAVLVGKIEAEGPGEATVVTIDVLGEGARPSRTPPRVDSAGRFEIQVAPGRYRVSAACAGAAFDAKDVTLVEGETVSVVLRPQR